MSKLPGIDRLARKKKEDDNYTNQRMIVEMIEAMNILQADGVTQDGEINGESSGQEQEKIKEVISQLGSDCIEYKNAIHDARSLIRHLVMSGVSITGFIFAIFSGNTDLGSLISLTGIPSAFFLISGDNAKKGTDIRFIRMKKQLENVKNLHEKIKKSLVALRLERAFVENNFSQIVNALAYKKRMDLERQELAEMRLEMGLDAQKEITSETLEELLTRTATYDNERRQNS